MSGELITKNRHLKEFSEKKLLNKTTNLVSDIKIWLDSEDQNSISVI